MPRYLMNPATGSVDTEDNWRAEMPLWEVDDPESPGWKSREDQFSTLLEVASLDGKHWYEMDVFADYMDDYLREDVHSRQNWESEQDFLDAYVKAHAAKYDGAQFTIE